VGVGFVAKKRPEIWIWSRGSDDAVEQLTDGLQQSVVSPGYV
jgi:hypothetical protein